MSTWLRMMAWPRPQSSVQMTGNVPVRVGVTTSVLYSPGTASCFCESSGTQNEWMTSFDVMRSSCAALRAASDGRTSCRSGT